jgi:carboxymethylenebutenolidase
MGKTITLEAADGHRFSAYEKTPSSGIVRAGLVVVQEIFGVNAHIRRVADGYAEAGYRVIAPAIFDREERDVDLGYAPHERDRGLDLMRTIGMDKMVADIAAAVEALQSSGRVGIVGYCLGGTLAWLSAARVDGLACAVGYYGGAIAANLEAKPRVPVMLHFGEDDPSIPPEAVAKIKAAADPALVQIFTYKDAGHAFNRDGTEVFRGEAARVARDRTLAFLSESLA